MGDVGSVPLANADRTGERTVLKKGQLHHLLPPACHDDRIRGGGQM